MGAHPNIGFDKFPEQYAAGTFGGLGTRTRVYFNYDPVHDIGGEVVRSDREEPGRTIIKLDDGRHVLASECQWSPSKDQAAVAEHDCPACPVEVRDLSAVLHNLIVQLRRETALQPRSLRKLSDAEASLARWKPILDAHFAASRPTNR